MESTPCLYLLLAVTGSVHLNLCNATNVIGFEMEGRMIVVENEGPFELCAVATLDNSTQSVMATVIFIPRTLTAGKLTKG